MPHAFRKFRISTKLIGTIVASLIGLCVMGLIAVLATHTIQSLGRDLYLGSDRLWDVRITLAVDIERAIGDVHAAPSELDLAQLKVKQDHFSALLADSQKLLRDELDRRNNGQALQAAMGLIRERLASFGAASKKVFDLSAAFAQPDAIVALAKQVGPAEKATEEALHQFHAAAGGYNGDKVAEIEATTTRVTEIVVGLVACIVLALSAMAYAAVSRGVVLPMTAINRAMIKLAAGDSTVEIPHIDRSDELGEMAGAVEVFKHNMIESERIAAQQALARDARSRRQDAMEQHTQTFGTSVSGVMAMLTNAADGMHGAAGAMAEASVAVHREAMTTSDGAAKS